MFFGTRHKKPIPLRVYSWAMFALVLWFVYSAAKQTHPESKPGTVANVLSSVATEEGRQSLQKQLKAEYEAAAKNRSTQSAN